MHAPTPPLIQSDTLLLAYRNGIFPMADSRDDPEIFWVEPRERAIIPLEGFHLSKSLRKMVAKDHFRVTCNTGFAEVVNACAAPRPANPESWINSRIAQSYAALNRLGHAHSIECWLEEELVGGLYGVSFDRVFCGESMFSRADNASKVALAWLVAMMRHAGFRLLDCQFMTDHLASLGAIPMSQADYCKLVAQAQGDPRLTIPDAYSSLSDSEEADLTAASSPGKRIAHCLTQTS